MYVFVHMYIHICIYLYSQAHMRSSVGAQIGTRSSVEAGTDKVDALWRNMISCGGSNQTNSESKQK